MTRRARLRAVLGALMALALMWSGAGAVAQSGVVADSLEISQYPHVPGNNKPFQVTATGNHSGGGGGSVYIHVYLWPRTQVCPPTNQLADAVYYDVAPHPRWGVWGDNWVPEEFSLTEVFDGRPVGKYRMCAYLNSTWSDPMAVDQVDFTIGGTCASAKKQLKAAQKKVTKKQKALRKAKQALKKAKKQHRKKAVIKKLAKKVKKAKTQRNQAKKKVNKAKNKRKALC